MPKGTAPSKTRWLKLIAIAAIGLSAIYLLIGSITELPDPAEMGHIPSDVSEPSQPVVISDMKANSEEKSLPDTSDYQYCEQLIQTKHGASFTWGRREHKTWGIYLSDGYSLDEVTLAVEYFTNPNFAVMFRLEQLRKNTEHARQNRQLIEQFQLEHPSLLEMGLKPSLAVQPSSTTLEYLNAGPEERQGRLQDFQLNADELAFLIADPKFKDADIIALIPAVDDLNATVAYGRFEATSLLDYAVKASRVQVVEALLKSGLGPTSDNYLGSTMEWALAQLNHAYSEEKQDKSAKIVVRLQELNAPARFTKQSQVEVTGGFPRYHYDFNAEQIAFYMQNYGLDLTQINARAVPFLDESSPLLSELLAMRSEHLARQLGGRNILKTLALCEETVKTIDANWTPRSAIDVLSEVEAQYPDSPDLVISVLATIDPTLVDLYQAINEPISHKLRPPNIPDLDNYFSPLRDGDVNAVLKSFSGVELSDANRNWIVHQILLWDFSFYDELMRSEWTTDEIPYHHLGKQLLKIDSIEQLQQAGANLYNIDNRGKTLLFYAVEKTDVELIKYMVEASFPFSIGGSGQDPLHVALESQDSRFSPETAIEVVDMLMTYEPDIDEFHLRRMALLKLRYPRLYQSLVTKHTQLAVDQDTELPAVR